MMGGAGPSELLTLKVSVRHWPLAVTGTTVGPVPTTPVLAMRVETAVVKVVGPEMTKLSKSRRSY